MVRLKKKRTNDRAINHTFFLRLTRVFPAASFRKRRLMLDSLNWTRKTRVPLMSDTLKSLTASSTGYCARYCGPITTTGCSTGGYVLIAGMGLPGACPGAIITETKYYSEK